ncbi:ATP-binding cassette domain-containing protein [Spongiibacter nanhainus]|uniref:ATP-binding cassette domain-containing protein n=1 Tax=Spongiibacter nanhainus TaxID=2794344 RepID=A0A7T4R054_9GAMM|nr:ABC transporter ATP-binding protein [Spongiibacter nanhainus]QQD17879.1 ATP-binding cassette domain-containing protein [Spongiibacter nanhainus]
MSNNALAISNISYDYGNQAALNAVTFAIAPGQFFGLLGPNGAGKSTLMALLTRLLKPTSGDIQVFSRSLSAQPSAIMSDIGVVFQQSTLDLDLSVLQNLNYHGALHGLSARDTYIRVSDELHRFGLQNKRHARVRELNGGHRRRIELARAMLHRPKLLLLDEPTAGLDIESRAALNRHVRQLCEDHNIAVLWTTHLIEELETRDPLLILDRGTTKALGQADTLLKEHNCDNIGELFALLTTPSEAVA